VSCNLTWTRVPLHFLQVFHKESDFQGKFYGFNYDQTANFKG